MNIALFGYGKMGKMIDGIASGRKHAIVAKIDIGSTEVPYSEMDVAIDFSTPEAAFDNIAGCFEHGVPVVSGTTGWLGRYEEAVALCKRKKGAFIYASNFSLGVNLFFELNRYLASLMNRYPEYQAGIEEVHHAQKADAPSGTAISLAEAIIERSSYRAWKPGEAESGALPVRSRREGEVPGTHTITYTGKVDSISIEHKAHGREGFALGAVIAAEWLQGRTGVYSMRDVLNLA